MFKKNRFESEELQILKALHVRMELTDKDKQYYANLQKGFEGEVMFDGYLEKIKIENFLFNDLLIELNHSHFQIDSLMITQNLIYLFEVKNYEGEFYFEDEKFKKMNGNEIKNPLLQLERNESLLRQFFTSIGFKIPIEAYLVFVNPDFTLYQAPLDRRIILPTNLNRLIQQINSQKSTLNKNHLKLADKLLSSHLTESPFTQKPKYDLSQLAKGLFCHSCGSEMRSRTGMLLLTCKNCGKHENTKNALLHSIEEYRLLYPTGMITTNTIYEWCGGILPKKIIRNTLKENFVVSGYGPWSSYQ